MSSNERLKQILDYLKKNRTTSVEELIELLDVSAATIRRDLTVLQERGQIERSHGGAVLMEEDDEISIFIRQIKNVREKEAAVSIALKHMPDFQTVFLDNSSTCLALAKRINLAHKTVITNGLQIAMHISRQNDISLIIPGGEVKYNNSAVLGSIAATALYNFNFDIAITSCSALDGNGTYEHSPDTMQLKKIALEKSRKKMLIFDSTKVNTQAAFKTAALDSYDYIFTNAGAASLASIDPDNKYNIINK